MVVVYGFAVFLVREKIEVFSREALAEVCEIFVGGGNGWAFDVAVTATVSLRGINGEIIEK